MSTMISPVPNRMTLPSDLQNATENVTSVYHTTQSNGSISVMTTVAYDNTSPHDALFYIITVLMFYAISIVILMVKYIRKERQEAEFTNYYYDFVSRDKFQSAQYQNMQRLNQVMKTLKKSPKVFPKEKVPMKSSEEKEIFSETGV